MHSRSYHFIPANKPKLFDRSAALGADRYIFDLEDAVPNAEKRVALAFLTRWLDEEKEVSRFYVRLNGSDGWIADYEREFLGRFPDIGVVLPKIESGTHLQRQYDDYGIETGRNVIGLIESPSGLVELNSILGLNVLKGIGLGLEDFLSECIYQTTELEGLVRRVQADIALQAMASGVEAIDTISTDLTGGVRLHDETVWAKSTGLTGKFSIHPQQIVCINKVFSPDEELIAQAQRCETFFAYNDGDTGYISEGGEILSPPKLKKLKHIFEYAKHYGII